MRYHVYLCPKGHVSFEEEGPPEYCQDIWKTDATGEYVCGQTTFTEVKNAYQMMNLAQSFDTWPDVERHDPASVCIVAVNALWLRLHELDPDFAHAFLEVEERYGSHWYF